MYVCILMEASDILEWLMTMTIAKFQIPVNIEQNRYVFVYECSDSRILIAWRMAIRARINGWHNLISGNCHTVYLPRQNLCANVFDQHLRSSSFYLYPAKILFQCIWKWSITYSYSLQILCTSITCRVVYLHDYEQRWQEKNDGMMGELLLRRPKHSLYINNNTTIIMN